jgi:glycosyltransferase involved in cell wall biosynthesis
MTTVMPRIDVVIPAFNEEASIGRCLDATLAQSYPAERVRVLLVDAGCTDRTLEIARERSDPRLVIVANGGRRLTTPEALNVGIERSDADVVARVDAHGWPEQDFLERAVATLTGGGPDVACVGGLPLAAEASRVGRAFTLARGSRFGVGGSVYAAPGRLVEADTVPWGMYRREVLVDAGGFDPRMQDGEDEELNWRIRRSGKRILLDPAIRFRYVPRASLAGIFSQYRGYGRARLRVVAEHPDFLRLRHLAPAAMVAGAGALVAAAPFSHGARRALGTGAGAYAALAAIAAVSAARRDEIALAPLVAACFPALHAGYGVGMWSGIAQAVGDRASDRRCSLSSRRDD